MFKRLLVLMGVGILFNVATHAALNEPRPNITSDIVTNISFKSLGWNEAETLNGYNPDYTFYLPIAKNLKVKKAMLHLKMGFGDLASPTTIELRLNHHLVRRLSLPIGQQHQASWDIELPLDTLSEDWQSLSFSANLYSSHRLCNLDVWAYISPDSSLTLTYPKYEFIGKLNRLPYPFIDPAALEEPRTLLVLPAQPSAVETLALFRVTERLGELAGDNKVHFDVEFNDGLTPEEKKQNHFIFIGMADPMFLKGQSNDFWPYLESNHQFVGNHQTVIDNNSGLLMLVRSPWNSSKGVLGITGLDPASFEKSVSAFMLPEFTSLAAEQVAVIHNLETYEPHNNGIEWHLINFKTLGYVDKSVSGLGKHTVSYTIPLPNNFVPEKMTVQTLLSHPNFREADYSQITLLMNGKKQASRWLGKDQSLWSVRIESDSLKPGQNKLDYVIDMHLNDEPCTRQNYDQIWATIQAESTLSTSFKNSFPQSSLNELPVPFTGETTIVIPDTLSQDQIKSLNKLFYKLGQLFQDKASLLRILTSNQIDEDYLRHHSMILIGTPESNPWIKSVLKYAPISFDDRRRSYTGTEKALTLTANSSIGLLELTQSPWHEKNAILLITGNNVESLMSAINTLVNDKKREKLDGNIAIINTDQSIETMTFYENLYMSYMHHLTKKIMGYFYNSFYFVEDNPQIIVYLLVFIIPVVVYLRRRKKH